MTRDEWENWIIKVIRQQAAFGNLAIPIDSRLADKLYELEQRAEKAEAAALRWKKECELLMSELVCLTTEHGQKRYRVLEKVAEAARARLEIWTAETHAAVKDALAELDALK